MEVAKGYRIFLDVLVVIVGCCLSPVRAATPTTSIAFEPSIVVGGSSFAAILNAGASGDELLALDVTIEFDAALLMFGGYLTAGTMTHGFAAVPVDLTSTTASLVQDGGLSPAESGPIIKALLSTLAPASSTPIDTTVRFFGTLGLDQGGEIPFNVSEQLTLSPVPEPAAWINMLFGAILLSFLMRMRMRMPRRLSHGY